ncbi:MAG: hypothetical protein V3T14_14320 [Myxococcota bacterium]
MKRRLRRRLEALRDGALPLDVARRLSESLRDDPLATRILQETEVLGRAVREAWRDGPPAPDPERLIAKLRPGLARIDRELAGRGGARQLLDRLVSWPPRVPTLVTGVMAAALALVVLLPPLLRTSPVLVEPTTQVLSLRQKENAVFVLNGWDGTTIIWVLDEEDPDLSEATSVGGWV